MQLHIKALSMSSRFIIWLSQHHKHHVIPLFFLSKHHHYEVVTLLSVIYYLPESERDPFIQLYQQDLEIDFRKLLNLEQIIELDLFGYLLIST